MMKSWQEAMYTPSLWSMPSARGGRKRIRTWGTWHGCWSYCGCSRSGKKDCIHNLTKIHHKRWLLRLSDKMHEDGWRVSCSIEPSPTPCGFHVCYLPPKGGIFAAWHYCLLGKDRIVEDEAHLKPRLVTQRCMSSPVQKVWDRHVRRKQAKDTCMCMFIWFIYIIYIYNDYNVTSSLKINVSYSIYKVFLESSTSL